MKLKHPLSLIAALAAFTPVVLSAQTPNPPPGPRHGHPPMEGFAFKRADTNQDGAVSREEALAVATERVDRLFETFDANQDGLITQDEIQAKRNERRAQYEAHRAERFRNADTNGDGLLSKEEVQAGMPYLARNFDRIDSNKDGQLSPEELKNAAPARRSRH
jgi:Ca2+-binding EF-hand superfamily protein